MANRRMFSMDIVDSDAFLDMSISAQCLYFHLSMRADDDGFVSNPKKIMRMCGGNDDDYRILLLKRFLIMFESGVCVIKHWKIHNYIRKDTYNETRYVEEKSRLSIKENGAYTDRQRSVDGSLTQVRLGKVRLVVDSNESKKVKDSLKGNENNVGNWDKTSENDYDLPVVGADGTIVKRVVKKKVTPEMKEVFDLFNNPAKAAWHLREIERVSAQILFDTYGLEKLKIRIQRIEKEKNNKDPLFPLVTTPSQLLDKMPNVERYFNI